MEESLPPVEPERRARNHRSLDLSESWHNLLMHSEAAGSPPTHEPPLTRQPESLTTILKRTKESTISPRPEKAPPPTEVLQQVEKAADKNIAIEDRFERSHEIKDTPQITQATPVTSDNFTQTAPVALQAAPITIDEPAIDQELEYLQPLQTPTASPLRLYRQAITYGFLAALALLIAAAIFFLIR